MTDADLMRAFGTIQPPPDQRRLVAGPISAILEDGQIRYLRFHGIEAVRGIAWLARDTSWGTLSPRLSPVHISETADGFTLRYGGAIDAPGGQVSFEAEIAARAEGWFRFRVASRATTDFVTNRTGFVVLHPDSAAGTAMDIRHPDGTAEKGQFPLAIMADQPAFEIVGLGHEPAPGLRCDVSFDGGVFEMEDQRNWSDASFKTYVRPQRLPRPYTIPAGSEDVQVVTVRLSGRPAPAVVRPARPPILHPVMPRLWLRLAPDAPLPDRLPPRDLANGLIVRHDPQAPEVTVAAADLARRLGWSFAVEALLPLRDPVQEIANLFGTLQRTAPDRVLLAGLRDLKTRASHSIPPGEVPLRDAVLALRSAGYTGQIGAGTPAFFTEFNRNPPPPGDFAWFANAAIVHAADDVSVIETTGVLDAILDSAAALVPGTPLFPGPLTMAPAVSPYAPALAENPSRGRVCMARVDPRHSAAFGAAHFIATMARIVGKVADTAPMFLNGPSGCFGKDGQLLPVGSLHAVLASAAGQPVMRIDDSRIAFGIRWTVAGAEEYVGWQPPDEAGGVGTFGASQPEWAAATVV
jgi:D-apionolactonase